MPKPAGIWKKVKSIGKSIGGGMKKAFNWVNENIIRPNKNLINNVIEPWDDSGIIRKVIDGGSEVVHNFLNPNDDQVDTKYQKTIQNGLNTFIDQTQNGPYSRPPINTSNSYSNSFENASAINNKTRGSVKTGRRRLKVGGD